MPLLLPVTGKQMSIQFALAAPEIDNNSITTPNAVVAVVRKHGRCDSEPQGRPEKMSKGYEHTDHTDTEMESFMRPSSSSSASSASAYLVSEIEGSLTDCKRSWKRDEEFYLEDGSCVLLVGDILFNVGITHLLIFIDTI